MNEDIRYIGPERRSGKVGLSKHRAWEVVNAFERAHDELELKRGSIKGRLISWFTRVLRLPDSKISKLCRFRRTDSADDITDLFLASSDVCEKDVRGSLGEKMQTGVQNEFRTSRDEILVNMGEILARSGVVGNSDGVAGGKKEISSRR